MKVGRNLQDLAAELERRAESKRDYKAPASKITLEAEREGSAPAVVMNLAGVDSFPIEPYAHGQLASYAGVPKKYYDRMLSDAPDLLAKNVNNWLGDMDSSKDTSARMVRTLDSSVRAVLSTKYRALENEDLAETVLPVLLNLGEVTILSADITATRFYIKAVDKSIERDIPTGRRLGEGHHFFDTVSPAITISNSEIGAGTLSVETSIFTRMCTNLATMGASIRKYHAGSRMELGDEVMALLSDETRRVTDEALWRQIRDITGAAFEEARFEASITKLGDAAEDRIDTSKVEVIEVVERSAKKFSWTEEESGSVLKHLVEGADLTRYGLHAAVTRTAEDLDSYDRASEFEKMGGRVIDLSPADWTKLAA